MKPYLIFPGLLALLVGCYLNLDASTLSDAPQKEKKIPADTTPRVTGIGGIFLISQDPVATQNWYAENLGIVMDPYGAVFEFRNANRPGEINYLRWSLFQEGSNFTEPSKKEFMVNYRVQNIEGLVRNFYANGVEVLDSIATYDYGKFVHILDPDGNKIELWEPQDWVLTGYGSPTNK